MDLRPGMHLLDIGFGLGGPARFFAAERNRRDFAIEQTERSIARMQQAGNTGPGMALLMGEKTPILVANILGMMKEGLLEPVEMVATAN